MSIEQGVAVWSDGFVYLCEGAGVHGGGLDVQHHPVHQRLGTRHKAYSQPETSRESKTSTYILYFPWIETLYPWSSEARNQRRSDLDILTDPEENVANRRPHVQSAPLSLTHVIIFQTSDLYDLVLKDVNRVLKINMVIGVNICF